MDKWSSRDIKDKADGAVANWIFDDGRPLMTATQGRRKGGQGPPPPPCSGAEADKVAKQAQFTLYTKITDPIQNNFCSITNAGVFWIWR